MAARPRRRPGEFELIARYFQPLATDPGALKLLDDAAVYRQRPGDELVFTVDMVNEGVHFFPDDSPESIARKALRVNLSDLASKGAKPFGYLLALALREDWTEGWLRKFAGALKADQERYGVALLGGDTVKADRIAISITAVGRVPRGHMVQRAGARPGDAIFVSGTIGDAALGLRIRKGGLPHSSGDKALIDRYLHPQPRVGLAPVLTRYATSAIDVSDGLLADLGHICEVSGVGSEIDADHVPLSPAARRLVAGEPALTATVLAGGDDYEILATVPDSAAARFSKAASAAGVPVTRIGSIVAGEAPPVVRNAGGEIVRFDATGHKHF
jgi:thiamine-monophosphate kinase